MAKNDWIILRDGIAAFREWAEKYSPFQPRDAKGRFARADAEWAYTPLAPAAKRAKQRPWEAKRRAKALDDAEAKNKPKANREEELKKFVDAGLNDEKYDHSPNEKYEEKEIRVASWRSMSNTGYHQMGKPTWWAYYKDKGETNFVNVPYLRGDRELDVKITVPEHVEKVYIGAGKKPRYGSDKSYRETVDAVHSKEEKKRRLTDAFNETNG